MTKRLFEILNEAAERKELMRDCLTEFENEVAETAILPVFSEAVAKANTMAVFGHVATENDTAGQVALRTLSPDGYLAYVLQPGEPCRVQLTSSTGASATVQLEKLTRGKVETEVENFFEALLLPGGSP